MNNFLRFLVLAPLVLFVSSCSHMGAYGPVAEIPKDVKFKPVWIKDLDPAYDSGNLPIALQSPLIHEGIVYIILSIIFGI